MFEIRVTTKFGAAHNLRNYGGKCENLHGHTWRVDVALRGASLNEIGLMRDFKDVKNALKEVLSRFDHSYLNELSPFDKINPTAENLSKHIFDELVKVFPELFEVCVWESEDARATYRAN
jgi:6-pyruvoyltetrahydropterin/6-carboxytetrahydropterin synthase